MKPEQKIENLEKQIIELRKEKYAVEQAEIEVTQYPRIKALVGTCLKSTYDGDYYRRIIDYVDNKKQEILFLIFEQISINKQGRAEISIGSEAPYTNKEWWESKIPLHGVEEISEEEYQSLKTKVFYELSTQKLLKKFLSRKN